MIVLFFILLIILDAVSDAMNKPLKHVFEAAQVLGWLAFPVFLYYIDQHWVRFPDCIGMVIGYTCLRYLFFDALWNVSSGQRIDYVGTTSFYDKVLRSVHPTFVLFTKLLAGAVGFTILLR